MNCTTTLRWKGKLWNTLKPVFQTRALTQRLLIGQKKRRYGRTAPLPDGEYFILSW
jgi:hypothetical protein